MDVVLVLLGGFVLLITVLALARAPVKPNGQTRTSNRSFHEDNEVYRRRAELMAEVEEHDIEAMLDGINQRRRQAGRREIGEELADELTRGTWK